MPEVLNDIVVPVFDFSLVERRTGFPIQVEVMEDIQASYRFYSIGIISAILAKDDENGGAVFPQNTDVIDQVEFSSLVSKIQKKAKELEGLIDALADFDCGLLIRPTDTNDRAGGRNDLRDKIDALTKSGLPTCEVGEQGFFDYYGFRISLDYFIRFSALNDRFNNHYSSRFTVETGHTNFERLIRRIVVALIRSRYPATVTIPTDTNPDYESPIISALLELQDQHNSAYANLRNPKLNFAQHFNYRQFAHMVSCIIDDMLKWEDAFATAVRRLA